MARTYQGLGSGEDVLVVVKDANADMSQVEIVDFTVLSKVDGARTIDQLLSALTLSQEQVLQSLRKFMRLGMVKHVTAASGGAPVSQAPGAGAGRIRPPRTPHSAAAVSTTPQSRSVLRPSPRSDRPVGRHTVPSRPVSARSLDSQRSVADVLSEVEGSRDVGQGVRRSRSLLKAREPRAAASKSKGVVNAGMPQNWPIPYDQFMFDPLELEQEVDLEMEKRKQVIYYHYHLKRLHYYDLFQVERDADSKEIRKAYFKLSKDFHPDTFFRKELGTYKERIEETFRWISKAYATLSSRSKRKSYDALLDQGMLGEWDERRNTAQQQQAQAQAQAARNNLVSQQVDALRRRAEQAQRAGKGAEAARFYQAALGHGRASAPLAAQAAQCLVELGQLKEAERVCTQALAFLIKPAERVETMMALAQIMDRQEMWSEAARWYREVCQIQPGHPVAQSQLARAERMMASPS